MKSLALSAILGSLLLVSVSIAGEAAPPFAPTDWPRARGPADDGSTACAGAPLVRDLKDARLVWISEERNLGLGWGLGHGASNKGRTPQRSCGYAGPVVAGGRVYFQYYEPAGDALIRRSEKGAAIEVAELKDPRPESWAVGADDLVLCMDAATGGTRWKARLPGGMSWNWSRDETFLHPVIVGDTVFVQGTAGRVHALKASDGSVVWSVKAGPGGDLWEAYLKQHQESGQAAWGGQVFNASPNWADGIVFVNDGVWQTSQKIAAANLVALDAATGKVLWVAEGALGRAASPTFWRHDGKAYVIAAAAEAIRCFEALTGKVAWELAGTFVDRKTPLIVGDRMLVSTLAVRGGPQSTFSRLQGRKQLAPHDLTYEEWLDREDGWQCYRLSAEEPPVLAWRLPMRQVGGYPDPIHSQGRFYIQTYDSIICVDPAKGDVLARGPKVNCYTPLAAMGGRLFQYGRMLLVDEAKAIAPGGALGEVGGFKIIPYLHWCVADGRLYVRGWLTDPELMSGDAPEKGAIACFDLRQEGVRE